MLSRFDRIRIRAAAEQGAARQRELRRKPRFRTTAMNPAKLRHGAPTRAKVRS
jgi:hypothetical protein